MTCYIWRETLPYFLILISIAAAGYNDISNLHARARARLTVIRGNFRINGYIPGALSQLCAHGGQSIKHH